MPCAACCRHMLLTVPGWLLCHLQHATPALDARAAAAGGRPPGSSSSLFGAGASSALSGLQSRLESSLGALGLRLPQGREEAEDPLAPFLSEWGVVVGEGGGGGGCMTEEAAAWMHWASGIVVKRYMLLRR
jgi:hypothetical protein